MPSKKKDSWKAIGKDIVEIGGELSQDCQWCDYWKGTIKHHPDCIYIRAKALLKAERKEGK